MATIEKLHGCRCGSTVTITSTHKRFGAMKSTHQLLRHTKSQRSKRRNKKAARNSGGKKTARTWRSVDTMLQQLERLKEMRTTISGLLLALVLCPQVIAEEEPTVASIAIDRQDLGMTHAFVRNTDTEQMMPGSPDQILEWTPEDQQGNPDIGHYSGLNALVVTPASVSYAGGDDRADCQTTIITNVVPKQLVESGFDFVGTVSLKSDRREAVAWSNGRNFAQNQVIIVQGPTQNYVVHVRCRFHMTNPPATWKKDEDYSPKLKGSSPGLNELTIDYNQRDHEWRISGMATNVTLVADPIDEAYPIAGAAEFVKTYDFYFVVGKFEAFVWGRTDLGDANWPLTIGMVTRCNTDENTTGSQHNANGYVRLTLESVSQIP